MSAIGDWAYWLLGFGVLAVNATLVYVAWWALFSDRSKGRRRCPRCWYDMAYAPAATCAECGFTASREVQFQGTRRRYGVATLAIASSVAISLFVTDRVTQHGFTRTVPTRVLLWFWPLVDVKSRVYTELTDRARFGQFSESNWIALVERSAAGDFWAKPVSDEWIEKYGDLLLGLRSSFVNSPRVETPLWTIPARIDATTREVWPVGMAATVNVQVRDWWPWGTECRVRAQRLDEQGRPMGEAVTFYRSADYRYNRTPYAITLPPLDASTTSIDFDIQVDRRRLPVGAGGRIDWTDDDPPKQEEWEAATRETVRLKARALGDLEQLAKPNRNPELMSIMRQAFGNGVVRWSRGRSPMRFNVAAAATHVSAFDDTAIGVSVELLCDGEVARRLNMWWLAGTAINFQPPPNRRNYAFEVHLENIDLLRQADPDDGRWQIRVRSDPQIALRAGAAPMYWEGEFTIPLKLQVRPESAPPRPWRRAP